MVWRANSPVLPDQTLEPLEGWSEVIILHFIILLYFILQLRHVPLNPFSLSKVDPEQAQRMRETGLQLIQKALAVLQIFALSQFGCAAGHMPQNMWSQGGEAQDYGPLLQKLEGAVERVRLQASRQQHSTQDEHVVSYSACLTPGVPRDELTASVRKELALALRDILAWTVHSFSRHEPGPRPYFLPAALQLFSPDAASLGTFHQVLSFQKRPGVCGVARPPALSILQFTCREWSCDGHAQAVSVMGHPYGS